MEKATNKTCDKCLHEPECTRENRYTDPFVECPFFEPRTPGICATCARRDKCEKRKATGGVWHCPDYM